MCLIPYISLYPVESRINYLHCRDGYVFLQELGKFIQGCSELAQSLIATAPSNNNISIILIYIEVLSEEPEPMEWNGMDGIDRSDPNGSKRNGMEWNEWPEWNDGLHYEFRHSFGRLATNIGAGDFARSANMTKSSNWTGEVKNAKLGTDACGN